MQRSVLVVEDDEASQRLLQRFLEGKGWKVYLAGRGQEALAIYETARPAIVLSDIQLPYLSGIELLEVLRERDPDAVVILVTAHANTETAIEAVRLGAESYLTKPVDLAHLEAVAERAYEKSTLRRTTRVLTDQQGGASPLAEVIQQSAALQGVHQQIGRLAASDAPVLLQGETGTGKSWVAQQIHCASARARAPLLEVNCAGISREDLERELFGQERLTARGRRVEARGAFENADGGTLFLDEVGALPLDLQPRLLRALESGRFRRVGGTEELETDVRVIASTHRDLEEDVRAGRLREDLYYRIAVVPIALRPLREQGRVDVIATARELLRDLRRRVGKNPGVRLSPDAEELIARYDWPGNLRELRNTLERILILHPEAAEILPAHLPAEIRGEAAASALDPDEEPPVDPTLPLEEVERRHIAAALRHYQGNRMRAAKSLGIGRRTLYDKIARYGLDDIA